MFAKEWTPYTVGSQDGHDVIITVDGGRRRAALLGYAHALAALNMPRAINDVLGSDARFDAETWYRFRFVDEAIALFVTDAHKLLAEKGSLAAALDAYPDATAAAYRDPSAPMYVREQIVRLTTFSEAPKTASLYVAANAFSSFLLRSLGQERSIAMAQTFLTGEYRDLAELFSFWGGFDRAMEAWKGDPAAPRSGVEALMQLGLAPAEQRS